MLKASSQRVLLARRPDGAPTSADFSFDEVALPTPTHGEVLLAVHWLSIDPFLRGILSGRHLGHRLEVGDLIPGTGVGQVVSSTSEQWTPGDWAVADCGWCTHSVVGTQNLRRWPSDQLPPSTALGVLGMPGLTAWAGVRCLVPVRAGETLLVSAASGAVGGTAGQLAKLAGARVVGIAGGPEKCGFVTEQLGFDACIDHRAADFADQLRFALPDGLDVYFDNVGGAILALALKHLRRQARVVLCGLIDQYNQNTPPPGPNLGPLIAARGSMHGLVVYDWFDRYQSFFSEVAPLVGSGALRYREDISHGLQSAPEAFCRLMRGQNFGKALVRLSPY